VRCLRSRVQILAFQYKPEPQVGGMLWQEWSQQGLNAMGRLVADSATGTSASARTRQPDAARHAAIHADRAGDRNGALFHSRHPARPWRGRLGNGEGEFSLIEGAMWQRVTPNRVAAQRACGQASLPWADRDCSTRGSHRLCP